MRWPFSLLLLLTLTVANGQAQDTQTNAGTDATSGPPPRIQLDLAPDVEAGEVLRFTELGWSVKCMAFSPNGRFVAAGKLDETLLVFDLRDKRQVVTTGRINSVGQFTAIAFSPDSKKLLAGCYQGQILIWDFKADGSLGEMRKFSGHGREVKSIYVSKDSRRVLSGSSEKRARYWDLDTRRELFAFDAFAGPVNAVYLPRNGRQGLATDGKTLSLLDVEKGGVLQSMKLTNSHYSQVTFSPDGRRAAASDGRNIRIWEIKTGRQSPPLEHKSIHRGMAFSPSGRYLLSASGGQVNLWDTSTSRKRYELDTAQEVLPPNVLAFAPDGRHFAAIPDAAGQTLQIMRVPPDVREAE